jgi:hypothetical protein
VPDSVLFETFGGYPSANEQLAAWVKFRHTLGPRKLASDEMILPVVFRPQDEYEVEVADTGPERNFIIAELMFLNKPNEWEKAIELIGAELPKYEQGPVPKDLRFRPAFYAGVAARNLIARKRYPAAAEFLQRGLKLEPGDEELNYLVRLLEGWAPEVKINVPQGPQIP